MAVYLFFTNQVKKNRRRDICPWILYRVLPVRKFSRMDTNKGSVQLHSNIADVPPLVGCPGLTFINSPVPWMKYQEFTVEKCVSSRWSGWWSHRRGGCQVSDNCSSPRYNISKCEITSFLRRPQNNNILQLLWGLIIWAKSPSFPLPWQIALVHKPNQTTSAALMR